MLKLQLKILLKPEYKEKNDRIRSRIQFYFLVTN